MLDAEIVVAERFASGIGCVQCGAEPDADLRLGGSALDARLTGERCGERELEARNIHASFLEDRRGDTAFLLEQGKQHVQAVQLRVSGFRSNTLRRLESFLEFLRDFFESHGR